MCLVVMLAFLDAFRWPRAVNRSFVPLLFRLPFANRAFDSGDLYIDFDQNHLIFPAVYLVFQVDSLIILSLPERAYPLHIISYLAYHAIYSIMLLVHCTVIDCCSFSCVLALGRAVRRVRERGTC